VGFVECARIAIAAQEAHGRDGAAYSAIRKELGANPQLVEWLDGLKTLLAGDTAGGVRCIATFVQ
jgi:hypothetical protein